jgi:WD40 repeat protein
LLPDTYVPRTLKSEIRRRGRLPVEECVEIGLSLATALAHLHRHGLVHRDVKPSNIIFVNGVPKLADIGLVTNADATLSFVGTEGFVPPEGPGTPPADIYSLGKVLYELSTGLDAPSFPRLPEDWARQPNREELHELNQVVLRACEASVTNRYPNAEHLCSDLLLLQSGKSLRRLRSLERWKRRIYLATPVVAFIVTVGFIVQKAKHDAERRSIKLRAEQSKALADSRLAGEKLAQAQLVRLTPPRVAGWSDQAWDLLGQAARCREDRNHINDVRNQAAANLSGFDARLIAHFPQFGASTVLFDKAGTRLLMGPLEDGAKLWDGTTNSPFISSQSGLGPVAFLADGTPALLRYDGETGSLTLADVIDSRVVRGVKLSDTNFAGAPKLAALTPDGSVVISTFQGPAATDTVLVSDFDSVRRLGNSSAPVTAVALSSDRSLAAIASYGGQISVWTVPGGHPVAAFRSERHEILCLRLKRVPWTDEARGGRSQTSWLLAAGDAGGNVTIWDVRSQMTRAICRGGHYDVTAVTFSPDGTLLASGGRGPVKLWDTATGRVILEINASDPIADLDFAPDGNRLAVSIRKGWYPVKVTVWQLENGRGAQTLCGHSAQVSKICFSPDGRRLAALSHSWQVGVWNLDSGQLLRLMDVPTGHSADNAALTFSPDGHRFAFCAGTNAALWDLHSGKLIAAWMLPAGKVDLLSFQENSGTLTLCRGEISSQSGFRCHFRIGKLAVQGTAEFTRTSSEGYLDIYHTVLARSGEIAVVEGTNEHGRTITAYNTADGAKLWSHSSSKAAAYSNLTADPAGEFVAFRFDNSQKAALADALTGKWLRTIDSVPIALGPGAARWLLFGQPEGPARGLTLVAGNISAPFLRVGIDAPSSLFPCFNSTGERFAWGNVDGSVTICNLKETHRRLTQLNLQW